MQTLYVKFTSQADREKGFYELASRARVASFPGEIYQIPISATSLLEKENIGFRRATDEEVRVAHDQIPISWKSGLRPIASMSSEPYP